MKKKDQNGFIYDEKTDNLERAYTSAYKTLCESVERENGDKYVYWHVSLDTVKALTQLYVSPQRYFKQNKRLYGVEWINTPLGADCYNKESFTSVEDAENWIAAEPEFSARYFVTQQIWNKM